MKKVFLGIGVVLGTMASAQTTNDGIRFGIKGGGNLSTITDGKFKNTEHKFGFNGGVFMNVPLSSQFNFQPEVIYNYVGAKTTTEGSSSKTYSTNLGYVTVPLMVQLNVTPELYVEAGPEFGYLVNANNKLKDGNTSTTDNWSKDALDELKRFNAGGAIGLGYRITDNWGVNARYTNGFTKIGKKDTTIGKEFRNSKNENIQLGLNYTF
ncbi:outer membrane beta-barrel protein [Elizabethkingia argentiflava]|uniref:Outer membrane beta-barrel protein n=1 Tax=Elizabethkingia argenteiflava TaxID=2681556 RepID=A0A845PVC8_9FLAO|nr:porin family protein [Elizabethkingia argenteiflava]NAW51784.1 outer membrane beta-barrel protein [Elizabethkingia argenteiflava]